MSATTLLAEQAATQGPARLVVLYDRDCGLCLAAARWLRRVDRLGGLALVPLQEAPAHRDPRVRAASGRPLASVLHAVDEEGGSIAAGGPAVLAIAARLPGGRPWAWLLARPPFRWTVAGGYALVAANRHRIGRWLRLEGPGCLVDPTDRAQPDPGRAPATLAG